VIGVIIMNSDESRNVSCSYLGS